MDLHPNICYFTRGTLGAFRFIYPGASTTNHELWAYSIGPSVILEATQHEPHNAFLVNSAASTGSLICSYRTVKAGN